MNKCKQVPLYLAPMAGITDKVFRRLCCEKGCDVVTTEMISAPGVLTAPKTSRAYTQLLDVEQAEGPIIAQIFGHHADLMADAARMLTDMGKYSGIDINMGCPAPKVTSGGSGSALMKTPDLAAQIIRSVCNATLLPVTVKMRLGWDDQHINCVEFAQMAEQCGACAVTVHGRTRRQLYSGKADWEKIAEVKNAVGIRVIANGDVVDADSAEEILRVTDCDGIAIGRGALGNPWLFGEIKARMRGESYTPPSYAEVVETAMRHARDMEAWKGNPAAVMEMRKHFGWYVSFRRGARKLRTDINVAETFEEVEKLLRSLEE
ncbi:MAG: tRNA dihydrouridine synthase DusB [Clostridiales bacterium]|nr:tRNA dihydrouridine synthase DusB [Clostridiales bacterium]